MRSLALTVMSGCKPRKEAAVRRPRRYRPVKTSSKMTGRPDQDVVEGDGALGLKSCGLERVTWVRVYWNRGSLAMVIMLVRVMGSSSDSVLTYAKSIPPAPRMIGSMMRAPNFFPSLVTRSSMVLWMYER